MPGSCTLASRRAYDWDLAAEALWDGLEGKTFAENYRKMWTVSGFGMDLLNSPCSKRRTRAWGRGLPPATNQLSVNTGVNP